MRGLELRLLGTPRVIIDGRESTFRTRKALALLVFLAVEGGMHRRDKLAELLWPASKSRGGRTALRSALASVRRALEEGDAGSRDGFLKIEGGLLGVEVGPDLGLDLAVVREASEAARASRLGARLGEKDENLISALRSADAAYRGEFLEGFRLEDAPEFDLWVETQRGLWRARVGEVLGRLSELEAETGELATATGTAERWVARDPMEEVAHVRLMEARSATGDSGGALAAYEEYRSELRDVGMDPGAGAQALNASMETWAEADRTGEGRSVPGSLLMPFVGREAEFGALVEEYRAARSGTVRSVVVLGETGIGKTRLVEQFLGWAASRGADTLRGRTSKTEVPLPYEALVDALRPRLERERAPDDLLEDPWLSELSRILPEIKNRYPDLPAPADDEASARALLFEALARLGAALAGGSTRRSGVGERGEPLVVFLDDLQWSDGATLDALGYACRSWAREGVSLLLLVAAREEDLRRTNLGGWIPSFERELPVRRITLTPIDEKDIYGLLRLIAGATQSGGDETRQEDVERVGRWLREQSGGHPLFLAQIVGALLDRGVLAERAGQDARREIVLSGEGFDEAELRGLIPAGLRELILDKLRPLSAHASDMLTAGAVIGGDFGFESLLVVAGRGEALGLSALDGLVSARLLEESGTPSGGTYSFTHDKIRDVVYTEAGEARREVFHRRALEYLEDRGAPAAELARHALAAGLRQEASRRLLEAAEDAMAVFAAGDAVGYYERAQELLEDPPPDTAAADNGATPRLPRLYGGLARACALVHDWARAQEAYERMLAAAREAGDREAEWGALHGLGVLAIGFTVGPEDDELLRGVRRHEASERRAATMGGADRGPERARSEAIYSPNFARRYSERALSVAREIGRKDLVLRSEFGLGVTSGWVGLWAKSVAHMEEAVSLYAALDDGTPEADTLLNLMWSNGMVAWGKGMVDGPDHAFGPTGALQKHWRQAAELSDMIDTDYARAQMGAQAVGLAMAGEYEDAIGKASRGLEAARSLGHPQLVFVGLVGLGDAHRGVFALDAARSAYLDMFGWVYSTVLRREVHARLCAVAALSGEWEQAHGHALEASGLEEEIFLPLTYLHRHHDIEALLRGGDTDLVHENLRTFERRTRGQKGYFRLAYLRAEAVLARWNGDTNETLSLLYEALGQAERLGLPGETWQIAATLGETHEERGGGGPSERAFGRASVEVRRRAANIKDESLRKRYLAAPQTSRVLEKARGQGAHPDPTIP